MDIFFTNSKKETLINFLNNEINNLDALILINPVDYKTLEDEHDDVIRLN